MPHKILDKHPEVADVWFRHDKVMKIISGRNGEILDANNAFLEKIGYSLPEFQREDNPVTWKDISTNDQDLAADLNLVDECYKGNISEYTIIKKYRAKNSTSDFGVKLHVQRYPIEGGTEEFKFFLVTVYDTQDELKELFDLLHLRTEESIKMSQSYSDQIEQFTKALIEIKSTVVNLDNTETKVTIESGIIIHIKELFNWITKQPKQSIPLIVFIAWLWKGNSIFEFLKQLKEFLIGIN